MPLFKHTVRNDHAYEILAALTALGEKDIATAMTWPLAQARRTFRYRCETIDEAKQLLLDRFTEWALDKKGAPRLDDRNRRVPAPVYMVNDDGSPRYKLDESGAPTTEREIKPGNVKLTDVIGYDRAMKDLMRETADVEIPHLSWPQLEGKLKTLPSNLVEAIMDFLDSSPADPDLPVAPPKDAKRKRS